MPGDKQVKNAPLQFDPAESVEAIAKKLIPQYHTHLVNAKIAYLFKNKPTTKGGKLVLATAKKCSKEEQALCNYHNPEGENHFDFIITVFYKAWSEMSDAQKFALVDHELSHCLVDEEPDEDGNAETQYKIISHDFEEFYAVIERHGDCFKSIHSLVSSLSKKCAEEMTEEEGV